MMDDTITMTSDLRRSLAGLVCKTVWRGSSEQKRWLADRLEAQPFELMSTEQLVGMADQVASEADVARLLHMVDETLYEIAETFLCGNCFDEGVVRDPDDRWHRCFQCNPYVPKEPKK